MLVTFRLTRAHERGAVARRPCLCPVARCLSERLGGYDYLGVDGDVLVLRAAGSSSWVYVPLPADVTRYVWEFDFPDRTAPAALPRPFALDVPPEFLLT